MVENQWCTSSASLADPGYPVWGRRPVGGGGRHRPPMQVLFGENVYENERIGPVWGAWIRQ